MREHLVNFEESEWINPKQGIRYKTFEKDEKIIRLMELTDAYCDLDWCQYGHISYIISGQLSVKFMSHIEIFEEGDTVFIPIGKEHEHIASVPKGEHLTMLSFEM